MYPTIDRRGLLILFALVAALMSEQEAYAQPGWVLSHQKISDTQGGFKGTLENGDRFGGAVTAIGDLDGDGVTELAVGAVFAGDNRGAVWVLFLNGDGTVRSHQQISDSTCPQLRAVRQRKGLHGGLQRRWRHKRTGSGRVGAPLRAVPVRRAFL